MTESGIREREIRPEGTYNDPADPDVVRAPHHRDKTLERLLYDSTDNVVVCCS